MPARGEQSNSVVEYVVESPDAARNDELGTTGVSMSIFEYGNGDDVDGATPVEQDAADEQDMQASLMGLSRLVTRGLTLDPVW
jgi:hypothetical protein